MVSDHVVKLCCEPATVSSTWADETTVAPSRIVDRIYGSYPRERTCNASARRQQHSKEQDEAALRCGNWGQTTPSPLFLQAYADAINCLDADPLSGVVSPPLMGSRGTMPLTVIAPLADVIRHCANMIAAAEREVFFVTCAWSPSLAQKLIRAALLELSRRAAARTQRVKVHVMYDSAGPSSLLDSHRRVKKSSYTAKSIGLPAPEEIPYVDLEVMNLHTVPLGTLHSKFCVVDAKSAAVMSNNMQDNDNLEMMTHLEGPIVESIRDTAIITWYRELRTEVAEDDSKTQPLQAPVASEVNGLENGTPPEEHAANGAPSQDEGVPIHKPEQPHYDTSIADETFRIQNNYTPKLKEKNLDAVNRVLNLATKKPIQPTAPDFTDEERMVPYIDTTTSHPVPMAMVSRPPYGWVGSKNAYVPQNEAWLSLIRNAKRGVFIQTPDLNAAPLIPELVAAVKRGVEVTIYVCFGYNDFGEMIPGQGGTNDQVAKSLLAALPPDGPERKLLKLFNYVGKDQDHPIHHSFKTRSCHIKLLIVDGTVGIQGSGNQDTQSWFHSQEVNVMVDSEEICAKWREYIDRNQNTKLFGRVSEDGIWRDKDGNPGPGYMGNPGTVTGLVKGVIGMAMKMEGLGGF